MEECMSRVPRYWKGNDNNLSVGEFAVMLLFAAIMFWLVPWLKKHGFRSWAMVTEIAAAIGLVVCVVRAFI